MKRIQTIAKITECGVVAVIRAESESQGRKVIEAVKDGGIKAIEITMTVPGAVDIIKELAAAYEHEDLIIGAGTVLDPETARTCILAGAEYIVSPSLNLETIKLCNRYRTAVMPGVITITEALLAMEYGAEIIKIFPGNAFGPDIIKAFKGPVPQGNFMPTGGVNLDNIAQWIKAGAVAVGTGGDLTKGAADGNYRLVTETAKRFVEAVSQARGK
ncbi:MAG: bifunctional 2-keto-4-hydroxyglutarate aldolase/2-keto-3-deoxy-6-phosphogluconate aldolase [Bacillota bacterium]|jgi:2-dehydro-3-deoxyphosphogluconate aldolase/(4S)-4-hydroxy-2-oxoglutarate aldolase|nr:bifunctional 2-keto-4-hydroxyglutarate aldolase/2-keto-3-deoxy-6-phosphogluconate aldolase [Bacillota bacterium]